MSRNGARLLFAERQEQAASDYSCNSGPKWNVDRFLLLHRKLERTDLHGTAIFRVGEAAEGQRKCAAHNEYQADELCCVHMRSKMDECRTQIRARGVG